jgi:hypothetical protein
MTLVFLFLGSGPHLTVQVNGSRAWLYSGTPEHKGRVVLGVKVGLSWRY